MTADATFAVALNCMDGRTQLPANAWLQQRFGATYIDTVTEAGIVRFCTGAQETPEQTGVLNRINVSVNAHGATQIAVIAHAGCAGNPIADEAQKAELGDAVRFLATKFPELEIIAVWIGADWRCVELET